MYTLGYSPEEMATLLKRELAPQWLKYVPGGSYLNLCFFVKRDFAAQERN